MNQEKEDKKNKKTRWVYLVIPLLIVTTVSLIVLVSVNFNQSFIPTYRVQFEAADKVDGPYRDINKRAPVFDFDRLVSPQIEPLVAFVKISNRGNVNLRYRLGFEVTINSLEKAIILEINHLEHDTAYKVTGTQMNQWASTEAHLNKGTSEIYQFTLSLDINILTSDYNLETTDPQFPLGFAFDILLYLFER
jgi:hypothetical protein